MQTLAVTNHDIIIIIIIVAINLFRTEPKPRLQMAERDTDGLPDAGRVTHENITGLTENEILTIDNNLLDNV